MDLQSQLLFFFSGLGAFNGVMLGLFFLFYVKPKHKSNLFLGLLLLALSIRVGKSIFFYFNDNLADVYIQIGLFACWFIGPLLYFYMKSALEITSQLKRELIIHFSLLFPIALFVFWVFPRSQYEDLWFTWFINTIYIQWALYTIITGVVLYKNYDKIKSKDRKNASSFKLWILSIYLGNAFVCVAFNVGNYTSYIVGALSFTFLFYLLMLLLFFTKKRNQLIFLNPIKHREHRIETKEAELLIVELNKFMIEEEAFKDAEITLAKVAKKLKILPTKLSLLLNDNMNSSFTNYLNKMRIEEAKRLMALQSNYSIEAIGYDCGFNSKSVFYASFKKHTGLTPSKYRDAVLEK